MLGAGNTNPDSRYRYRSSRWAYLIAPFMKSDMVVRPSPLPDTAYDREEGVSLSLFYYISVGR